MKNNKTRSILWIVAAVAVMTGSWAGYSVVSAGGTILSEVQKFTAILKLIQTAYVEEPDLSTLTEGAIEGMLKRLDPHSTYLPAQEQEKFAEKDQGEFEGIGISFVIQNELITVISPIPGTPAEKLGIRSGDRIVEIDGVSAYGITNEEVFQKLRGEKGTTVEIKVARDGVPGSLEFTIVRDKIPINSIWTSFMLDDNTGYVQINQFTQTTTPELQEALVKLEKQGMERLLLDLRNNQGGRLTQAVDVVDKFIPGGHVIVSRKGRSSSKDTSYHSTDEATHKLFDLIVLISNGSASASEIVAGAVQDLDRGLVVGERSFGKGLVQYPYAMRDGGVIRLSTAHWYTPSGRLVQRPYDHGRGEYYAVRYRDPEELSESGEREEFHTLGGRVVYASSGITPDEEVENGKITVGTARIVSARLIFSYAEKLVHKYGLQPDGDFVKFRDNFEITLEDLQGLQEHAAEKDVEVPTEVLEKDRDYIATLLKAEMAQLLWNSRDYYYMMRIENDPVVSRARELFEEAREVASLWYKSQKG